MAGYDFLGYVLNAPPGTERWVALIPEAEELWRRARAVGTIGDRVDLVRLTEAERAELSGPATLEDAELGPCYASLCEQVPEVLDAIGQPRALFGDLLELDLALGQLEAAAADLAAATRAGGLLLAAELSARCDQIEEAAEQVARAGTEQERYEIGALFGAAAALRQRRDLLSDARRARRERRRAGVEEALLASEERQRLLLSAETLKSAALPAPVRRSRRRG